jgi:hypothetical protein
MQTLVGMAAILFGIGGIVVSLVGVIGATLSVPDLVRIALVLRQPITAIAKIPADGPVVVRGLIEPGSDAGFTSFVGNKPIVFRQLVVFEQVGKHAHERWNSREGCRFLVNDGTGTIEVDGASATGLSTPLVGGGPMVPAVADHVGNVFAWPNTPKTWFENGLAVGDFVTVRGSVETTGAARRIDSTYGKGLQIVSGEPRLMATPEFKTLLWMLAAIPGGMVLSAVCWGVLQLTI